MQALQQLPRTIYSLFKSSEAPADEGARPAPVMTKEEIDALLDKEFLQCRLGKLPRLELIGKALLVAIDSVGKLVVGVCIVPLAVAALTIYLALWTAWTIVRIVGQGLAGLIVAVSPKRSMVDKMNELVLRPIRSPVGQLKYLMLRIQLQNSKKEAERLLTELRDSEGGVHSSESLNCFTKPLLNNCQSFRRGIRRTIDKAKVQEWLMVHVAELEKVIQDPYSDSDELATVQMRLDETIILAKHFTGEHQIQLREGEPYTNMGNAQDMAPLTRDMTSTIQGMGRAGLVLKVPLQLLKRIALIVAQVTGIALLGGLFTAVILSTILIISVFSVFKLFFDVLKSIGVAVCRDKQSMDRQSSELSLKYPFGLPLLHLVELDDSYKELQKIANRMHVELESLDREFAPGAGSSDGEILALGVSDGTEKQVPVKRIRAAAERILNTLQMGKHLQLTQDQIYASKMELRALRWNLIKTQEVGSEAVTGAIDQILGETGDHFIEEYERFMRQSHWQDKLDKMRKQLFQQKVSLSYAKAQLEPGSDLKRLSKLLKQAAVRGQAGRVVSGTARLQGDASPDRGPVAAAGSSDGATQPAAAAKAPTDMDGVD